MNIHQFEDLVNWALKKYFKSKQLLKCELLLVMGGLSSYLSNGPGSFRSWVVSALSRFGPGRVVFALYLAFNVITSLNSFWLSVFTANFMIFYSTR